MIIFVNQLAVQRYARSRPNGDCTRASEYPHQIRRCRNIESDARPGLEDTDRALRLSHQNAYAFPE